MSNPLIGEPVYLIKKNAELMRSLAQAKQLLRDCRHTFLEVDHALEHQHWLSCERCKGAVRLVRHTIMALRPSAG